VLTPSAPPLPKDTSTGKGVRLDHFLAENVKSASGSRVF